MTDPKTLDRLKALEQQATRCEWKMSPWHVEEGESAVRGPSGHIVANTSGDYDAELIAEMRNALPQLLQDSETLAQILALRGVDDACDGDARTCGCPDCAGWRLVKFIDKTTNPGHMTTKGEQ